MFAMGVELVMTKYQVDKLQTWAAWPVFQMKEPKCHKLPRVSSHPELRYLFEPLKNPSGAEKFPKSDSCDNPIPVCNNSTPQHSWLLDSLLFSSLNLQNTVVLNINIVIITHPTGITVFTIEVTNILELILPHGIF